MGGGITTGPTGNESLVRRFISVAANLAEDAAQGRQGTIDLVRRVGRCDVLWARLPTDGVTDDLIDEARSAMHSAETAVVRAILNAPLSPPEACDAELQALLSGAVPGCLGDVPKASSSLGLARLLMGSRAHRDAVAPEIDMMSLCGLVLAICRYADSKYDRDLTGVSPYALSSAADIALAAQSCGDREIMRRLADPHPARWHEVRRRLVITVRPPPGRPDLLPTVDEQLLHRFMVAGVQPRIAELEFRRVARSVLALQGPLLDLNLEVDPFHPQDVRDAATGTEFDVKSNVLLAADVEGRRRHRPGAPRRAMGLRGFFIGVGPRGRLEPALHDLEEEPIVAPDEPAAAPPGAAKIQLAAMVFHARSDDRLWWSFIGTAPESALFEHRHGRTERHRRVLPFAFSLPGAFDTEEWAEHLPAFRALVSAAHDDRDPRADAHADNDPSERVNPHRGPVDVLDPSAVLMSLDRAEDPYERPVGPDERAWRWLTNEVLRRGRDRPVDEVVRWARDQTATLTSPWMLHRPVEVDRHPLLEEWLESALVPLARHMDEARCPTDLCGLPGTLEFRSLSSDGTLLALLQCQQGHAEEVTVLAHCHDCGEAPLVIGVCGTCPTCNGLRCDGRNGDCDRCKASTRGGRRIDCEGYLKRERARGSR